jgi:hypothetical protein
VATKREELEMLARGEGALAKAADDEEVFIMVSHDAVALETVLAWALSALRAGSPPAKIEKAMRAGVKILAWQSAHADHVKVPD